MSTHRAVKRRLEYLCSRYTEPTKYHWQFVIWFRLLMLTVVTILPDAISEISRVLSNKQSISDSDRDDEEERNVLLLWIHAIIACVVLFVFAVWHVHACPFNYRFQNVIETALSWPMSSLSSASATHGSRFRQPIRRRTY